jgi:RNA polymerase sigma factor (sigma-70 family)
MTDSNDPDLIAQSQAGDKQAFSRLVTRHWSHVQRVLLAAGVMPDEVEDVLQEAFLQAYLNLDNLRQPPKFRAWVCGIALNLARLGWRQRPFTLVSWEQVAEAPLVDDKQLPERAADRHLLLDRLNEALADLPPSEREALLLIYRDGLSHRETADLLGTSLGAIKVRAHRGRRRLQTHLQAGPVAAATPLPAKEIEMIPVQVVDVIARLVDESRFGLDKRQLFAPLLADLPAAQQEMILDHITISAAVTVQFWESALRSLAEKERKAIAEAMNPFLPHRVVLLQENEGERILPIWVGPAEGDLLALYLREQPMTRPLTADLVEALLVISGTQVVRAAVSKLHEQIFYGTLTVRLAQEPDPVEVDCRPSDALVLATRLDIPIFVAPAVMDATSIPATHLHRDNGESIAFAGDGPLTRGQWRSLAISHN